MSGLKPAENRICQSFNLFMSTKLMLTRTSAETRSWVDSFCSKEHLLWEAFHLFRLQYDKTLIFKHVHEKLIDWWHYGKSFGWKMFAFYWDWVGLTAKQNQIISYSIKLNLLLKLQGKHQKVHKFLNFYYDSESQICRNTQAKALKGCRKVPKRRRKFHSQFGFPKLYLLSVKTINNVESEIQQKVETFSKKFTTFSEDFLLSNEFLEQILWEWNCETINFLPITVG